MSLSPEQRAQVEKQLAAHRHEDYFTDIDIGAPEDPNAMGRIWKDDLLRNRDELRMLRRFLVKKDVMRPEVMTSVHFARFLSAHPELYFGEAAVDMGCGTGIQGCTMLRWGAKEVAFTDVRAVARENAGYNAWETFKDKVRAPWTWGEQYPPVVVQGDLFEKVPRTVQFVAFNHPFFEEFPSEYEVSGTMGGTGLIHRFFEQARQRVERNGRIAMPYFHLAGEANDPGIQGPRHGYRVVTHEQRDIREGLQQGLVSFYVLEDRGF